MTFKFDELFLCNVKVVLAFDKSCHTVERGLKWLLKLGGDEDANEGKLNKTGTFLLKKR